MPDRGTKTKKSAKTTTISSRVSEAALKKEKTLLMRGAYFTKGEEEDLTTHPSLGTKKRNGTFPFKYTSNPGTSLII